MNSPIIELKNIKKSYISEFETQVLNGISLKINRGDFIAITGPSGSGKSTLMHIIGLLDTPTSGEYILEGKNVTGLSEDEIASLRNKHIGFVFQQFNLLKRASTLDNVILPAIYAGVPKAIRKERAEKLLKRFGLGDKLGSKPNQLSGGQQQRVAIARSLINEPTIILADEPTGNLDTKSGEEVMTEFKALNKEGITIVLVTHEKDIASQAKKIIKIQDGQIV